MALLFSSAGALPSPKIVSLTPAVFHLSDEVNAVSRSYGAQPIVPRGPAFAPILAEVRSRIISVLAAADYQAVLLTGSGSTAMAAVLGSCLSATERLLVIRNGAYGDRLLEFSRALQQPLVDLESPYGERPDLQRVEELLASKQVDAVTMVYGSTSTCTLNPVPEVGALCKKYGAKFLVDGVSSLFVEPMQLAAWNISAVMGSCNKGLHSHPNLTMCLVRDALLEEMAALPQRAPSLELHKLFKAQQAGSHPYTIDPMSLLQVGAALQHLESQGGVAGRHAIYQQRCARLRAGYERLGLTIARWPEMPLQSIGTALAIPQSTSYEVMAQRLSSEPVEGHTFEIYSAQGKLSKQLFRIFHMGDYELEVYDIFLRALARVL